IAWQIERHFGRYGEIRDPGPDAEAEAGADGADGADTDRVFITPYANSRQLISWVLGLGEHARILGPPELADELCERVELLIERHVGEPELAPARTTPSAAQRQPDTEPADTNGH